ncbi:protein kinase PINOID [Dendrobium catenatum]|uniref:non-specific serine/threonine protein kinase n=1 Tax=Dendrobium catenatum TaxID=906689 RepID=A0A2I0XH25_9ASPA|nr:protein kinase PINOID [Dendrobium catenatum]PKU87184.1 Protein kinase PINOID [Dendrobium catenatum]
MIASSPDSDGEIGSEMVNSSQSSMSSGSCERCSSFSRLSFDTAAAPQAPDCSSKPHRSSDAAWAAIRSRGAGRLGPKDFKLLRRIGSGDIGNVYLCRLRDDHGDELHPSMYAIKIVDKQALEKKKKLGRADTERRILRVLDHPFLPTLYTDFDASPHFSCVVMEYCSGGDLHSLRHRQPGRRFTLLSARFYAAEVLLALEYLHMLGIVYRDLKPENILIRSDGHIMLSDFDLSLESFSAPVVEFIEANPATTAAAVKPSCLPNRLFRSRKAGRRAAQPERRFVAEPVEARSNSFVGTHEYVAPEVAAGGAHGSAVDWWAYGVFLYEMLYGRTPFAGPTNEATLRNILKQPLAFPQPEAAGAAAATAARDLIAGLLKKDPSARLGSRRGAADVKTHKFFKGLNFALLRSCQPPMVPGPPGLARSASCMERQKPARFAYF